MTITKGRLLKCAPLSVLAFGQANDNHAIAMTNNAPTQLSRVLIVDDQPANVLLVHQILGGEWSTFVATNGNEALSLCAHVLPDLVLLDVNMPGLGGLQTCRQLKANAATCDIPVIFVTGSSAPADEDACWNAGAADFVAKPINPTTLRHRVRVHIAFKKQSDLLRQLAFSDPLTGLANRRQFDSSATEEWQRARRQQVPLSIVLVDVDYFKRYNDRYGHSAGDRCLVRVAGALRAAAARPGDLTARYGGEEFILLLPDTGQAGALIVAQRAANDIRELKIAHDRSDVADVVTVSIGVATAAPVADGSTWQALMDLADTLLYRAKSAGRARIEGALAGAADDLGERDASNNDQGVVYVSPNV